MRVAARIASIVPRDPRPPRRRAGAKSREPDRRRQSRQGQILSDSEFSTRRSYAQGASALGSITNGVSLLGGAAVGIVFGAGRRADLDGRATKSAARTQKGFHVLS